MKRLDYERLALFQQALVAMEKLEVSFPAVATIRSIIIQIKYLISVESGEDVDRTKLKKIVLGVQAAREIEPLSLDVAQLLYRVADEVPKMEASDTEP
jgi:hypothetical protein